MAGPLARPPFSALVHQPAPCFHRLVASSLFFRVLGIHCLQLDIGPGLSNSPGAGCLSPTEQDCVLPRFGLPHRAHVGAVHWPRRRTLEVNRLAVVTAAVAGRLEFVFAGLPVGRASRCVQGRKPQTTGQKFCQPRSDRAVATWYRRRARSHQESQS